MTEPPLSLAISLIQEASLALDFELNAVEVDHFLRSLLLGPKDLWACTQMGLVTEDETAHAITGHVQDWFVERSGHSWEELTSFDWDTLFLGLKRALFEPPSP